MIDHKRKMIFIHIPKTAGTYIDKVLGWPTDRPKGRHYGPKQYEKYWNSEYYKFTFVRNPYDRFISSYFFHQKRFIKKKKGKKKLSKNGKINKKMSEMARAYTVEQMFDACAKNKILKTIHLHPQHVFVKSDLGYDFIGKFENLHEDLDKIFRDNKLPKYKPLAPSKTSKHEHYSYYFRNAIFQDKFYNHYEKDFKMFNYPYVLEEG